MMLKKRMFPITYTFTFGDNVPIVIEANDLATNNADDDKNAAKEEKVLENVAKDGLTLEDSILDAVNDGSEDADIVALPISSKFVVNFQKVSEDELPIEDDIKKEVLVNVEKEETQSQEKNDFSEKVLQAENTQGDDEKSSKVPMKTK